ncbi:MAG: tRNA (adenosine(37)-N6)-threonylcarbamoyltransferase complex dimerization subunit type 1 TsaB [Meiothermus sp.]|uniref:tRNA (adenosine(37)-N6)-threonylcarbamoyltransferase complex dimerization subunit type 1 TsaB n=1 Tax=Meiothermus sp. TaxID=1955249 RepID=UPI0025D3589D|nr:tRNA (adenosine(37)-N6)-threonylcarbamoyltransferase complex dimerization subunit type 1 TsaB [Meiothermus sp.]MCS7067373.1 tRNA (adenosine(37)-N6)-threonylcarbamoyltransferase complex dimerization subunit type 1 TsaB [Meiothermus sp.]MCX7600451.1 tRNA (adenosine(37)-N6)-threonylcarbamoyltransferase complex dimerization subunit type 1 TsaB [Meiothermus sp.]MDW8424660.1 tRNA (adenosine(37)-N6)-threonylcarbamoyltransferase complex dimerization subunit type 1 TsaB [Meiothermus sp.]
MLVLALDTATPYLVLGLPHAERAVRLGRRHAEVLWGELEAFLHQAGIGLPDLDGIAVGRGPGSYTGLRVGIAAGLGLARGLGVPVTGVDTLEATALRYRGAVTVAQTTRNGLCYTASYQIEETRSETLQAPHRSRLDVLQPTGLLVLDQPPSGRALAHLGIKAFQAGRILVEPLYL